MITKMAIRGGLIVITVLLLTAAVFPENEAAIQKRDILISTLDEYAAKGYNIIGPVDVVDLNDDFVSIFKIGSFELSKVQVKTFSKKGGLIQGLVGTDLFVGRKVYVIRRGKEVIIICTPKGGKHVPH